MKGRIVEFLRLLVEVVKGIPDWFEEEVVGTLERIAGIVEEGDE